MADDVSSVSDADKGRAVAALVMAFTSDPFLRWMYPEADTYLTTFGDVVHAFGGQAFDKGSVFELGDFAAVAMWMPPGVGPGGDELMALFDRSIPQPRLGQLLDIFDQMDEHHPSMPHWYLPWLGVDCHRQGEGLGTRLLGPCLDMVDGEHLPAYLDSTNAQNIPFYERHGFAVTAESRSGDSPPMISMLRPAR